MLPPHRFINAMTTEKEPSEDQRKVLMLLTHDHPTAGHPGRDEMIRKARKFRQWKGMNKWITNYVKRCVTCQQNKIMTHRKKTPLF
jgi:hypothetical protein